MDCSVSRREFLATSAGVAVATGLALAMGQSPAASTLLAGQKEPAALAAAREKAKHRRRRLIYNNDGDDIFSAGSTTPDAFLSKRLKHILGTQVDSVFYCMGETTLFNHLAQVGETYGEFCRDGTPGATVRDNIRALKATGADTLSLAVNFCHKNNLEIFSSHRINDIHDSVADWDYLLSRWKRENPKYLLGTPAIRDQIRDTNSPKFWWSALDFEHPEVRDYLCRIQEDVCTRYDIDGMEIDYFRSPMFFKPNLDYQPATSAQVEMLTNFQRRVREIHYQAGTKRGRPLLTAVRVPATPAVCLHVGIDIERWIKEGLADIVTVGGGYAPFTEPFDEIRKLCQTRKIPFYATISASGMRGRENRYSTPEAWRGAASNMWRAGVDGIYTFNIFPTGPEPLFQQMGSPETLAGLDKLFAIDNVRVLEGDLVQGIVQAQMLPQSIPGDGKTLVIRLPIGDDLPAAARQGKLKSAELRVQLSNPKALESIEVKLNGARLTPANTYLGKGWLTFQPAGKQYRAGSNVVTFRSVNVSPDSKSPADVLAVEVEVHYQ